MLEFDVNNEKYYFSMSFLNRILNRKSKIAIVKNNLFFKRFNFLILMVEDEEKNSLSYDLKFTKMLD